MTDLRCTSSTLPRGATGGCDASGSLDRTLYATHDANFNVTAAVTLGGIAQQRFLYDAYGARSVLTADWQPTTEAPILDHGHQGGRSDAATGFILFRHRYLSPGLMRWTTRDPAGYVDGGSLYQYLGGNPHSATDPFGCATIDSPVDALAHYYSGGGYPIALGDRLCEAMKRNLKYQDRIARILESGMTAAKEGRLPFYDFGCDKLSAMPPFSMAFDPGVAGYLDSWSSNWALSVIFGTIDYFRWHAEFREVTGESYEPHQINRSGCTAVYLEWEIQVDIRDTYDWRGAHNAPIRWVVVNPIGGAAQYLNRCDGHFGVTSPTPSDTSLGRAFDIYCGWTLRGRKFLRYDTWGGQ